VNLPNSLTIGRIAIAPLIAWLPFVPSAGWRMVAFLLFLAAAISDYYDGKLARTRNAITPLGQLLDPFADKLLLVGTLVPMYVLMAPRDESTIFLSGIDDAGQFPFVTPLGELPLPWWVIVVVLGREIFMTVFRQIAARRGMVIAAIGPAKLKTIFQLIWVGAAYFWFSAQTATTSRGWSGGAWTAVAHANGLVGAISMMVAVALTLLSLWLYLRHYGHIVWSRRPAPAAPRAGSGPGAS
jgi:CDP-diacylglycerol---glycerol-3-phosphate 3-phosphatidyltransferase